MQKRHIALFAFTALLGAALGRAAPINPYGLNSVGKLVPADNVNTSLLSGPITCTTAQGTGAGAAAPWSVELSDGTSYYTGVKTGQLPAALVAGHLDVNIGDSSIVMPVSGTFWQTTQPVSAASLPLPSGAAADSSVNGILLGQNSTTSGQTGPLVQGSVTSAAPTYTTARTSPLSLTTAGALRVDGSASTQPVSGPLTDTQLRATPVPVSGTTTTLATAGTTPTLTVVAMTTTGAQVWAASSTAKARKIYNQAANDTLYCVYYDGTNNVTSEATSQFSVLPGQTWEMPNFPGIVEYTGIVRCALKTSTGNINATQVL